MFLDIKDANICGEVRPLADPYACLQWLHPSYCTHTLKYDLNYSEQYRFRHRLERDRKSAERQALGAYSIISICASFKRSIYCAPARLEKALGRMRGSHHCYFLFACRLFTWQSQWRLPPQVQNVFDDQFRLPTIEIVGSKHPSLRHGWCVSASIFTIRENREYFLDTITLVPHDCGPLASQWHDIASPESCSACKVSSGTRPRTSFRKEHRADRRRSLSVSTLAAPSPPPGFDVDVNYDTSKFLNPIGVYLCALDCMFHFDLVGWHQSDVRGLTIWADRHNVQLDLDSYVMTQGGPQLTTVKMKNKYHNNLLQSITF